MTTVLEHRRAMNGLLVLSLVAAVRVVDYAYHATTGYTPSPWGSLLAAMMTMAAYLVVLGVAEGALRWSRRR